MNFRNFSKSTQTKLGDIITELINFYKDDILSNQIAKSALKGFSITRPFYKLYEGAKDIIVQPYLAFKHKESLKKGFKKGMKNFLVSFSSQGLFFGEKLFRGIKIATFQKSSMSLKKKSLYKAWVYRINKRQRDYEKHYFK